MVPDESENEELNDEEDDNFIDNKRNFMDQEPSNYRQPKNIALSYEESMKIDRDELECSDPEHFVKESPIKREFCKFKGFKETIDKFNESMKQCG